MIPRTATAALFLAVLTMNSIGLPGSFHMAPSGPAPQTARATATQDWSEFKSPERGFAVRFPAPPKSQEQVLGEPDNKYTQYMYTLDQGTHAYIFCVFEYKPGIVPSAPDDAYFDRLINAYIVGSKATLRKRYPKTIAGHGGVEAIADDADGTTTHLIGVIAVGNQLYLAVSIGPTGHEASPEAARFRDSFRLL